ncbi:MAG: bifunctional phosphopantothenoylcysteine decarboxylase/phosphopantothenate--cysteine ligase CoaBC [Chloroflexi bacterium]|nr:MAG: bifunctional phosphopantothenoylcysteine decarboxylase/phosphopantothenate--cysteine ligase CoaBC [Chloroflexota bacterium]
MTAAPGPGARRLEGRLIALGVTGSIAAYKAVELLRLLTAEGADVVVLLSPSATRFVGPLSFAALSRHPVESDVLDLLPDGRIGHIVVADSADAIVVAPATAHWLAAMANGLAGDVVTAAALATSAPVVVAPAMDGDMWTHPATVANVGRLREAFGYVVVAPESGPLASGQSGVGRLAELPAIVDAVVEALDSQPIRQPDAARRPPITDGTPREADLVSRRIVITAGGTREPIDPVRYIGNRSTGRMGAALADAALARGAAVTLIAAAVEVALPEGADVIRVESTAELRAALRNAMASAPAPGASDGSDGRIAKPADALVMAAAVADFTPSKPQDRKIPRAEGLTLELSPTPDLLGEVASLVGEKRNGKAAPILVGFAAETGSLERAPGKVAAKSIDFLVANDVSEAGSGFGTDTNRVTIFDRSGSKDELPLLSKREVADRILDRVAAALDARDSDAQTAGMQQPTSSEGRSR